ITHGDEPQGGGAWVKEHGWGSEIFNFQPVDGTYYGYARPPGKTGGHTSQIKIERLGGSAAHDTLDNVTVFWVATNPLFRSTWVVGWYRDATVFRRWQESTNSKRQLPNGKI